jgi:CBS domain-containing protein
MPAVGAGVTLWRGRRQGQEWPRMTEHRHMAEICRMRRPVTLPPSATVRQAARLMRDHRIGAILVTDAEGRLLGIFTGRDAVARVLAEGRNAARTTLGEVMTPNPDTLPPRANAIEALHLMQNGGFRHVPMVEGDRVAGIVSFADFRGIERARLDEETGYWEIM